MFYDNYVLACELRGKKPTPVAQELGCTSSNVAQWKKGSTPRSAVLQKIAAYLDVTPQWLVFGDEGPDGDVIKKSPIPEDEADNMMNPDYLKLNAANRAAIDAAIAAFLAAQQSED